MNRLQIVQRLREKVGGAGTGPLTTVAQTGEALRLVNWCDEAWNEIQARSRQWKWMRKDFSFATTAGKNFYLPTAAAGETGITDFANWHDDTFRLYTTAIGRGDEQFLPSWDYETWRDTFDFGAQAAQRQRPQIWAERPRDLAIMLGNTPDAVYTVTGEYQATPLAMAVDADIPGLPARFHMIIVYRAMMLYGNYEAAPEVRAEGAEGYSRMLSMLEDDQLEQVALGEPLA